MATITSAQMQPADIIVSTATGAVSGTIRAGSMSRFSHAALYIGNGEVVEAIGEGVVRQSLENALADDTLAVVYRRNGLTSAQAGMVISFASNQTGKKYDYAGVVGASSTTPGGILGRVIFVPIAIAQDVGNIANMISPESSFFCSELVLRAFEKASVPISSSRTSSPGDIPVSHSVKFVGNLKGQ